MKNARECGYDAQPKLTRTLGRRSRMPAQRCVFCRKIVNVTAAQVQAQIRRQKVLGGGIEHTCVFHPGCVTSFERLGGRLPDRDLAWEVIQAEVVGPLASQPTPSARTARIYAVHGRNIDQRAPRPARSRPCAAS